MTIHLVTVLSENPDEYTLDQIRQQVNDWVESHVEWLQDTEEHRISRAWTDVDTSVGVEYLEGNFRFTLDDDKTTLLDDAEANLQPYVAWYRLGYHSCDHDENAQAGCSWDEEREYGTIPPGVPDFL